MEKSWNYYAGTWIGEGLRYFGAGMGLAGLFNIGKELSIRERILMALAGGVVYIGGSLISNEALIDETVRQGTKSGLEESAESEESEEQ